MLNNNDTFNYVTGVREGEQWQVRGREPRWRSGGHERREKCGRGTGGQVVGEAREEQKGGAVAGGGEVGRPEECGAELCEEVPEVPGQADSVE